ncbi:hypothetical protein ASG12_12850 [Williamsia sp. Leaf354]|uniref:cellulase family glycosylhydrolase n=1 Tax=Williamsia sp. Leaf354 TaxID=1736349 RepID=UPI0006FCB763|nr:cellulase family glycosylhydrolase [Williamsia sp. Leaf354]KQR97909.1 hypothetical protein ASG12_12850 [Williamsia sp. Leaf354]
MVLLVSLVLVCLTAAACGSDPTAVPGVLIAPSDRVSSSPIAVDESRTTQGIALSTAPYFDPAEQTRGSYDLAARTGLNSIRLPIQWGLIQPDNESTFDWTVTDRIVDDAVRAKVKILATLSSTPAWAAAPGGDGPYVRPRDPGQFAAFAGTVARRYKGKIADYEIWNEPNASMFYGPQPDPVTYTALLTASYRAIKTVDRSLVVVAGGLGPVIDSASTINPVKFLGAMYAAGAAGNFDALSFHPYKYDLSLADGWRLPNSPGRQLSGLRQLMIANGDERKKIWATEFGIPTVDVSEAEQARRIPEFIQKWIELPYVGPVFYYTDRDRATGDGDTENNFGLERSDGTPKPVVATLSAYARNGIPDATVDRRIRAVDAEPGWGRILSPVVPVTSTGILGRYYENVTVFSTPMGLISSPAEIAARMAAYDTYPVAFFVDGYQDTAAALRIFSSPSTGTHVIGNGIVSAWNPRYGLATTDEIPLPGAGVRVQFQNGSITWTPTRGGVGMLDR